MRSLVVLVLLAACGPLTEAAYPDEYASAWCGRSKRCDKDAFDKAWDSRPQCEEQVALWTQAGIDDLEAWYPGCSLSLEEADDCLDALRAASCDEFLDGDFGDECGTHLVVCDG